MMYCMDHRDRILAEAQGDSDPKLFVGPLETAATGTVLDQFPVLKPLWSDRDFFCLEHGHPSFLVHLGRMPLRKVDVVADPQA